MKSAIKRSWLWIKSHKKTVAALVVAILALIAFAVRAGKEDENLLTLTNDSLSATGVTVGGTVVAQEEVNLSFQMSGRVARVERQPGERVSQGAVIASLDTGTLSANILKAQADLDAEIAKLSEYQTQEGSGLTEVESKKDQLVRELQNAYTVAEDAVKNKNDQFFDEPNSRFPKIYVLFSDYALRTRINDARYRTGLFLAEWKTFAQSISKSDLDGAAAKTRQNIARLQEYLDLVATGVNQFEASDTHPQGSVDKYKSDIGSARSSLNAVLNDIINAENAVRSTTSQIPYQEAKVKSARAVVQNYQAELEKAVIRAPFTGLVTKQDAKVGMSAFADQSVVSMISDSNYGVDTYVPEVYIAQIKVGNKATVKLNPYGTSVEFSATVSHIDPAAAQRDGVASYKVELVFDANDERIKSGMTADVEIRTEAVNPAFWIPVSAVIDQGGQSYVKVKSGEATELRKVETGERTAEEVEIKNGLIVGDQIVTNK